MKLYILFPLYCLIGTTLSAYHHKSVPQAHEGPRGAIDGYVNGYYTFLGHQLPEFLNEAHSAFTGIESANKPTAFHQDLNSDATVQSSLLANRQHGKLSLESAAYSQLKEIHEHNPIGFNSVVGTGGDIEVYGHGSIHLNPIVERGITGDSQGRNYYTGQGGIRTETFSNLNDMDDTYQIIYPQRGLNQVANGRVYGDSQRLNQMYVEGGLSTGQLTNLEAEEQAGYPNIALVGGKLTNLNSYSNGQNYQDTGIGPNVHLGEMDYGDSSMRVGNSNKMSMKGTNQLNLVNGISTNQQTRQVLRKVDVNTPINSAASNPKQIAEQQKFGSSNQDRIFGKNRVFRNQYPNLAVNNGPVGTQRGYKSYSSENANIANQDRYVGSGYVSNTGTGQISNERGIVNNRRLISTPNYGLQNQMDYPETDIFDQNYYIDESAFENSMGVAPSQTNYGSKINQGSMISQHRGDSKLSFYPSPTVSQIKPVKEEPEHDPSLCEQNHPHEVKPILEPSSSLGVAGQKKLDLSPVVKENIKEIFGGDKPQRVREKVRNLNNDGRNSYSSGVQSNKVARRLEKESISIQKNYEGKNHMSSNQNCCQNAAGLSPLGINQINAMGTVKDTIKMGVSSSNYLKPANKIENTGYHLNQVNQMGGEVVSNQNNYVGQNGYRVISTENQVNPRGEVSTQKETRKTIFSDINSGGIYQTGIGSTGYENSVGINSMGVLGQTPEYPIYRYQPVINVNGRVPLRKKINRLIPYPIQGGLNGHTLQNSRYAIQRGFGNQYPLQSGYRNVYPPQRTSPVTRGVFNGRYLNSGLRRLYPSKGGLLVQYPRLHRRFPLQRGLLVNNRQIPLISLSSRFKGDESDQEEMVTGVENDYGPEVTVDQDEFKLGEDEIVAEVGVEDEYGPEASVFENVPTLDQDEKIQDEYEPDREDNRNIISVGTSTDSIEPEFEKDNSGTGTLPIGNDDDETETLPIENDNSGTGTLPIERPVVVANTSIDGDHNEEKHISTIIQEQNVTENDTTEEYKPEQVDGISGNSSETESSKFHTKETTQVVGDPQTIRFTIKLPPKIITTKTVTNLENKTIEQNPMGKIPSIVASKSQDGIQITIGDASFSLNQLGNMSHIIDLSSRTGFEQGNSKNGTSDGVESTTGHFNGIVPLVSQGTGQYSNDNVTQHNISVDDQMGNDTSNNYRTKNPEDVNPNIPGLDSSLEPKEKDILFGYKKNGELGESKGSTDLQGNMLKVTHEGNLEAHKQDDTVKLAYDGPSGRSYEDGFDASSVTGLEQKGLEEEIDISYPDALFVSGDNHNLEKEISIHPNVLDFRLGVEHKHHGHHHPILNHLAKTLVHISQ